MSGHSKWSNIKRKKEANDFKKSQEFTKVSHAISIAAREGGGDPARNPQLRLAIEKAKQVKMPKENIDRAIKKGLGALDGSTYEQVVYEGYGPGGVAFMVYAETDNKNRTVAEIKNIFGKCSAALASPGSTSYIFIDNGSEKIPTFTVQNMLESDSEQCKKLLSMLLEHEDVHKVYANFAH